MNLKEYLRNNRIITDGAMGTYFDQFDTGITFSEEANIKAPEIVKKIHKEYISAGARLIRTNTFAVNECFFEDINQIKNVIKKACLLARKAVEESVNEGAVSKEDKVYIGADIGPCHGTVDESYEEILKEYKYLCDCFLEEGIDVFVFETLSDWNFVDGVANYIKEKAPKSFILVQFSFDKSGFAKNGAGVKTMIHEMNQIKNIDAFGFNCGMSAANMFNILKDMGFGDRYIISALPNSSYVNMIRGKAFYSNNTKYFAQTMEKLENLGIRILGGCCGTTPDHIRQTYELLLNKPLTVPKVDLDVLDEDRVEYEKNEIEEKFRAGKKVIMVELDPPFDMNVDRVVEGAAYLKGKGTDVITLSDSPLGRPRMDSALLATMVAARTGMMVMPHIACRDRNTIAIRGMVLGLHSYGVRNLLVVTGDPVAKGDVVKPVFNFNSIKLMKYINTMNEEIFGGNKIYYGGALNYAGINKEAIAARMIEKMEAGASYFLSQPVYSDKDIERIAYLQEKTRARIIVGIMPLVSRKNADFINNEMPGIEIPDRIINQYKEGMTREEYEKVAVDVSVDVIKKIQSVASGYYFMTPFNRYRLIQEIIDRINEDR